MGLSSCLSPPLRMTTTTTTTNATMIGTRRTTIEWNEREAGLTASSWKQNHRQYHDWAKAKRAEQDEYWRWRHSHSDVELKLDIR